MKKFTKYPSRYIRSSRYIRASYSSSMPSWFREYIDSWRGRNLKQSLINRGVKLDSANFLPSQSGAVAAIPVYRLSTSGYGNSIVYIPGFNDEDIIVLNGRNRKLGSIGKSTLSDIIEDVVFIDKRDPSSIQRKQERYVDPRTTPYGKYGGQYRGKDGQWVSQPYRDKSGYVIPSPEDALKRYYSKFPRAVLKKIDGLYQNILDVRDEIFDLSVRESYMDEIGSEPKRYDRDFYKRGIGYGDIGQFLKTLDYIINEYRGMLNEAANLVSGVDWIERAETEGWENYDNAYERRGIGIDAQYLNSQIKRLHGLVDNLESDIQRAVNRR